MFSAAPTSAKSFSSFRRSFLYGQVQTYGLQTLKCSLLSEVVYITGGYTGETNLFNQQWTPDGNLAGAWTAEAERTSVWTEES